MKILRPFLIVGTRWVDVAGLPIKAIYDYFSDLDRVVREYAAERAPVTVANLPTPGDPGRRRFASNGRKAGESASHGTGVLVFDDGTHWIAVDTGATVAA